MIMSKLTKEIFDRGIHLKTKIYLDGSSRPLFVDDDGEEIVELNPVQLSDGQAPKITPPTNPEYLKYLDGLLDKAAMQE